MLTMVTVMVVVVADGRVDGGVDFGHGAGAISGAGPRPLGVSVAPERRKHVSDPPDQILFGL